ncbi:hypothetical protein [Bradyrhizobium cenepequi]|nr:hypothetical protein [Bradyrhizobium cenepequi]MCA6113015.1 hypothetical protein [Bradyrhizobium cenepequi]
MPASIKGLSFGVTIDVIARVSDSTPKTSISQVFKADACQFGTIAGF